MRHPAELAGKRVIVWAFQVTMSVLAKGDMQRDYGLEWRKVTWLTEAPEEIAVAGLPIRQLPKGADPIDMLRKGEADALINPHPPAAAMSGRDGIRRLDPAAECDGHFRRYGYFPIMHLIAVQETVAAMPGLPLTLTRLWDEAKALADDFHHDPGYGLPALSRFAYERQRQHWADDIWPSGLAANRANLERFIADLVDQMLLPRPIDVEELFHASVLDT